MRALLLVRPEPGLSESAARARALGLEPICRPLFRVEPLAWEVPDGESYDGLLLTSANAVRHAGSGLSALAGLPVHAVGRATAEAARSAGLTVRTVGSGDLEHLLERLPPAVRLLHLAGKDHRPSDDPRIDRRIVYQSAAIAEPDLPPLQSLVVAVHSPRAGQRLAELADSRGATAIAAISAKAAEACGPGWETVVFADRPDDNPLLALAASLCHTGSQQ